MAKYAPVAPPEFLLGMSREELGDYHLWLAHDVLRNRAEYSNLVGFVRDAYVILDNGTIELGHPLDDDSIFQAWTWIVPNVVVLPDYLENAEKTVEASWEAAERWRKMGMNNFMAVPQGKSIEEWSECARALKDIDGLRAWGVPRILGNRLGTRCTAVTILNNITPDRKIHLLGFSENLEDDIMCARDLKRVEGIDSASPLILGQQSVAIDPKNWKHPGRGDFWDEALTSQPTTMTIKNIKKMREWISNG